MTSSQVVRCLYSVSLLIGASSGSSAATIYTFTTIDVPGATSTSAYGINDAGQIVGSFNNATGSHGFLKDGATFTGFNVPGTTDTDASGINDAGQIVGDFGGNGFLKDGATFITIDVPGSSFTAASGINDAGQIVGSHSDATGHHGFVATPLADVPEPASWLLFGGSGVVGLVWCRRRASQIMGLWAKDDFGKCLSGQLTRSR